MKVIEQSHQILTPLFEEDIYGMIERTGRTAYKSENKITHDSAVPFIAKIIKLGHEAVLEHCSISVRFITDRGVTHELVRHRLCAYTQESTRYCNYGGKDMVFVKPVFWGNASNEFKEWQFVMRACENSYNILIKLGATPQEARTVLPNSLKTEIVCTANIREWRHIIRLRTAKSAHPQMRALMIPLLKELREKLPSLFNDVGVVE
jgi:thymidylate synthase (FAD)